MIIYWRLKKSTKCLLLYIFVICTSSRNNDKIYIRGNRKKYVRQNTLPILMQQTKNLALPVDFVVVLSCYLLVYYICNICFKYVRLVFPLTGIKHHTPTNLTGVLTFSCIYKSSNNPRHIQKGNHGRNIRCLLEVICNSQCVYF